MTNKLKFRLRFLAVFIMLLSGIHGLLRSPEAGTIDYQVFIFNVERAFMLGVSLFCLSFLMDEKK
ncbi:MAG TPA: hypothetical protein VJH71_02500 [Candidatus Paceibacterota bacterium]